MQHNFESLFLFKICFIIDTWLYFSEVLLVSKLTGLPPSPPSVHSGAATIDDHQYPHDENDGMPEKPLGVDVPRTRKGGTDRSLIAVIVLSSATAFIVCLVSVGEMRMFHLSTESN